MIDKIKVTNFKCFQNNEIRFRKLTVLAGSNSVGKSSILQSLLVSRITIEKLIQYSLLDVDHKTNRKIQIPLNGKYLLALGNTKEVLTRDANTNVILIRLYDTKANTEINLPLKAEDTLSDYYNLELSEEWNQKGSFDNLKNEFYYLNAERLGPRLTYDVDQQEYIHVGWQGEYAIQVLAQNKENSVEEASQRSFKDTVDPKLINQVKAWMNYIIPGFYIDEAELDGKLKKAYTTYSKSSPTNVGFGISYVLPIIVNGLLAKSGSFFIVENPEAHLHPKGQSNIGFFLGQLASSSIQVVIETHSEHVVNGIRRAALSKNNLLTNDILINFFSGIDNDKNAIIREIEVKETGDLSSFPKDFFDQVQQDMADIFKLKTSK